MNPIVTQAADATFGATTIVQTIVDAFSGLLSGGADAIVTLFNTVFMNEAGGISNFGIWSLAFIGVGAAFGIIRLLKRKAV